MIKTYRVVHQWEHWLGQSLGQTLLHIEKKYLTKQLVDRYGKYILLIGVPNQHDLIHAPSIAKSVIMGPLINKKRNIVYIESGHKELPIATASVDFVVLPHTLEFLDNPRQLLHEACRVIKPEGDIIIFGFNPYSLWGLAQEWFLHHKIPWSGHFLTASKIKHWLTLVDFELIRQDMLMFLPPFQSTKWHQKLAFVEWMGNKTNAFWGGVYAITAKAKVIPLTPIKLHWKQHINPLQVTLPGPSM